MGVSNGGGGAGASSISSGTAASRPAAGASSQKLYWATDTDEITFSDGSAWHVIRQTSVSGWFSIPLGSLSVGTPAVGTTGQVSYNQGPGVLLSAGGIMPYQMSNVIANQNNVNAASEATTATAGTNGAAPVQVAGYFVCTNRSAVAVKIPYYSA